MISSVRCAPLSPDADDAREWLERELSDPAYAAAEPTPFDRFAKAVGDVLASLFSPELPTALGPTAAIVASIVAAAVIVMALLVWGRPRRRARAAEPGPLFGSGEARTADDLRSLARAAAAQERWDDAIVLRFRAIARSLAERVVVDAAPGATAQSFAREAARAFPSARDGLAAAARAFDDVRYLRRPGSAALYAELSDLDESLVRTLPQTVVLS